VRFLVWDVATRIGKRVRDASHRDLSAQFYLGPLVGVRKAGLVSTSACAPLGAILLYGVVSAGNPNDCHCDSDICPIGHWSEDNGDHRVSSETVYHRLYIQ
jgi:hypothetical protein